MFADSSLSPCFKVAKRIYHCEAAPKLAIAARMARPDPGGAPDPELIVYRASSRIRLPLGWTMHGVATRHKPHELYFTKRTQSYRQCKFVGLRSCPALFEHQTIQFGKMKRLPYLIFALLLSGCSDAPIIKSSDRARTSNEAPMSVTATPLPPRATQSATSPATDRAAASAILSGANHGYTVRCGGGGLTLRSCYDQADEICETQKHFVSNILKIEESGSGNQIARALSFKCNTEINYGSVGFPDNAQVPALQKKPSLEQRLLLGN